MARIKFIQHPVNWQQYVVRADGREWLAAYGPVSDDLTMLEDAALDRLIDEANLTFDTAQCARDLAEAWRQNARYTDTCGHCNRHISHRAEGD